MVGPVRASSGQFELRIGRAEQKKTTLITVKLTSGNQLVSGEAICTVYMYRRNIRVIFTAPGVFPARLLVTPHSLIMHSPSFSFTWRGRVTIIPAGRRRGRLANSTDLPD